MLAIQLLGDLRNQTALPVSRSTLETEQDFYLVREMLRSLAKIGTAESEDIIRMLEELPKHEVGIVLPGGRSPWPQRDARVLDKLSLSAENGTAEEMSRPAHA
jgi:hypothetical protein